MTHYAIEPRDRILVKWYRFLYFSKNVGKVIERKSKFKS